MNLRIQGCEDARIPANTQSTKASTHELEDIKMQ